MVGGSYPSSPVVIVAAPCPDTTSLTVLFFRLPHDDSLDERFVLLMVVAAVLLLLLSTDDLCFDEDFVNGLNSITVRKSKDFGR